MLIEELWAWARRNQWMVLCPEEERAFTIHAMRRIWERADVPERVWVTHPRHAMRVGFFHNLRLGGASRLAMNHLAGAPLPPDRVPEDLGEQVRQALALVPPLPWSSTPAENPRLNGEAP